MSFKIISQQPAPVEKVQRRNIDSTPIHGAVDGYAAIGIAWDSPGPATTHTTGWHEDGLSWQWAMAEAGRPEAIPGENSLATLYVRGPLDRFGRPATVMLKPYSVDDPWGKLAVGQPLTITFAAPELQVPPEPKKEEPKPEPKPDPKPDQPSPSDKLARARNSIRTAIQRLEEALIELEK